MGLSEQILKVYADAVPGAGPLALLLGQALRLVNDIRVIPVDENAIHIDAGHFSELAGF